MIGLCLLLSLPTSLHAFGSIRSLLSTQAIVISILDEVTNELLDRPLAVREFCGIMNHHVDYFYIGCAVSSVTYFTLQRIHWYASFVKLKELSVYRNSYLNFRIFIFIIALIFIRDVENAI